MLALVSRFLSRLAQPEISDAERRKRFYDKMYYAIQNQPRVRARLDVLWAILPTLPLIFDEEEMILNIIESAQARQAKREQPPA